MYWYQYGTDSPSTGTSTEYFSYQYWYSGYQYRYINCWVCFLCLGFFHHLFTTVLEDAGSLRGWCYPSLVWYPPPTACVISCWVPVGHPNRPTVGASRRAGGRSFHSSVMHTVEIAPDIWASSGLHKPFLILLLCCRDGRLVRPFFLSFTIHSALALHHFVYE